MAGGPGGRRRGADGRRLVHRHRAGVEQGLENVEKFVGSFMDVSALPESDIVLAAIPEPRHGVIRRVVNTVVAGHRTAPAEPFIRGEAAPPRRPRRSRSPHADGAVDLVETLADPLPSAVIAHITGAPVADHDNFRVWSDELLEAQNTGAERADARLPSRIRRRTSRR